MNNEHSYGTSVEQWHNRQVLKIDKHKYVKIAYHGFKPLPRDERLATYSNSNVRCCTQSLDFDWKATPFNGCLSEGEYATCRCASALTSRSLR